jgi:catechol 2,3-dioxygenase-like lactoylglutathione lyase family enzyme
VTNQLDHVSVAVADIDRSVGFYHGLLGIPLLGQGEEDGPPISGPTGTIQSRFLYADLDLGGGQILELLQYLRPKVPALAPSAHAPGGGHVGLRVADLDGTLRRLNAAGVPPRFDPVRLESPAWWAGARVVYVSDPDGTTVELVERPSVPERAAAAPTSAQRSRQRGRQLGRGD